MIFTIDIDVITLLEEVFEMGKLGYLSYKLKKEARYLRLPAFLSIML